METLIERKKEMKTSTMTKEQIAFQRGMMITNEKATSKQKRLTIQAELMKFGYMLSKQALENVSVEWYKNILPYIKKTLGVGKYKPFYMNFPEQVMEMSDSELFFNAICHYWSGGTWEPEYELERKGIKFEQVKFATINLGTEKEFKNIFFTLVSINQSMTESDKEVIGWFATNYKESKLPIPERIPFKETLCILGSYGFDVKIKSPTDVLRIAVYLSGGDISLPSIPKPMKMKTTIYGSARMASFANIKVEGKIKERESFKFKKFSRSQRRMILGLLERTSLDLGEMKLKIGRWLRLGEILHPGEYKDRFPRSYKAFDMLRNKADKIHTYYSQVDAAFKKSESKGIAMLSERPGEYARKLDWMLREFDSKIVLKKFKEVSSDVSRKVLWELYNHFLTRDTSNQRSIMIKGKKSIRKKLDPLPPMSKIMINKVQSEILRCISAHFKDLGKLGNVWIDYRLKKIPLPFAMRSINTSIKTYIRGTRIAFDNPKAKVIRPYIHWNDKDGTEDLDLSVGFFTNNLKNAGHISYTDLKNEDLNCCHSGDIRQRQGKCAEYVDIDIEKCLSNGVRYALVQVHNFQSRPMHTMDECVFGTMEREFPESNMTFLPKSISNAMGLSNEGSTVCICILDLKEREYIWTDLELESRYLANIESTSNESSQILIDLIQSSKLSVYDLFELHAESRGKIVKDKKKAKTKFEYDDYITSYDKIATYM